MFLLTSSQWSLPLFLCHWLFLLSIFTQNQIILKSNYDQVQYSKCKSCRFWIKMNMWQLYNVVLQWCPGLQVNGFKRFFFKKSYFFSSCCSSCDSHCCGFTEVKLTHTCRLQHTFSCRVRHTDDIFIHMCVFSGQNRRLWYNELFLTCW